MDSTDTTDTSLLDGQHMGIDTDTAGMDSMGTHKHREGGSNIGSGCSRPSFQSPELSQQRQPAQAV